MDEKQMLIPAAEVMQLVQLSLCLVGNTSEYISQSRRSQILRVNYQSWCKSESHHFSTRTLFSDKFQSKLLGKIEKEMALAKAVSLNDARILPQGGAT